MQGSFIIEELTDLVEEAVLVEFDRITERGGVLGAMETMYQRGKIQEESLHYESLKHSGELPIIGVNTFLNDDGSPTLTNNEVIRAFDKEKKYQILMLKMLHQLNLEKSEHFIEKLNLVALNNKNIFEEIKQISVENDHFYITDVPSQEPNHEEFKEHRHDQSIFSLKVL